MSEIEIGEYVRTKIGKIYTVKSITKFPDRDIHIYVNEGIMFFRPIEIAKHSKNQKELIQEGDILEYQIYKISCTKIGEVKKYKDARSFQEYLGVEGFNLEQITILKILTKEKFEEESYKVGE